MCQIGLTPEGQASVWTFQPCLIPEHRTFSLWLWEQVRWCHLDLQATAELWASPSPLTVGGDESSTVTLTASWTGSRKGCPT